MPRKFKDDEQSSSNTPDRPPHPHDVLQQVASVALGTRQHHESVPRNVQAVARWWMAQQEQPHPVRDKPRLEDRKDGSGKFWKSPYIDRMVVTLRIFLGLDADFQGLILAAREEGIFWRGDSREFFMDLIAESSKMQRDGAAAYREYVKVKVRESMKKMLSGGKFQ